MPDAKPHDCDFLNAPLGYKGCHYEIQAVLNGSFDFQSGEGKSVVHVPAVVDVHWVRVKE